MSTSQVLENLPILATCDKLALARLFPLVFTRNIAKGAAIFNNGTPASVLYFIADGEVGLRSGKRCIDRVTHAYIGEEAALGSSHYFSDAIAETDVELVCIPREAISDLESDHPQLQSAFYQSMINHCADTHAFQLSNPEKVAKEPKSWMHGIGWLLAILIPSLVYVNTLNVLTWPSVNFLTIFSAAVVMWVFRLVPEYIPALFIVMAVIVLGLVPTEIVLSGYSSGSFFMALSVFGIGVVLVQSGLTYRFALFVLKYTPVSGFWYQVAMFFIGIFLTPVLPSANGRAGLVAPLLIDMSDILRYQHGGLGSTRMAVAAFSGISLFSACFLTAKSVNFALFGLFPSQVKDQFTWGYWLYSSLVAFAVMLVLYLILSWIFYKKQEKPQLLKRHINTQLNILGPMSLPEWIALMGIFLFILGVMTSSIHKIQPPWIGLAILYILLTLGSLSRKGFRQDIDWPFLLMLGGFVGLVKSMAYLGIDTWFSLHLNWIGQFMSGNFYIFVLILGVVMYLVRLLVPNSAAIILVASIFMPLAVQQGINPWVIGFIVIMFSDGWFMPYQCSYYLALASKTKKSKLYDVKSFLVFNAWSNLFRFAAIYASIPFWQSSGLL